MNKRLAKKLRKEMNSWTVDSPVRHRRSTFLKAWKYEIKELFVRIRKQESNLPKEQQ
jgi:hypothetical protein